MEWVLNDQVDSLIDAARATADVDEQAEIYRELQALLVEIQPDTFLLTQRVRHAMSDCLTGFQAIPMQSFDYDMYRYTWTCDPNG